MGLQVSFIPAVIGINPFHANISGLYPSPMLDNKIMVELFIDINDTGTDGPKRMSTS